MGEVPLYTHKLSQPRTRQGRARFFSTRARSLSRLLALHLSLSLSLFLSRFLSLALSLSFSLARPLFLAHTLSLSLSLTRTHTLSLIHTRPPSLSLTHTLSLFLPHTHSRFLFLSHTHTASLSFALKRGRCGGGRASSPLSPWTRPPPARERDLFIDNMLVRIPCIIVMTRWTGFAPTTCHKGVPRS